MSNTFKRYVCAFALLIAQSGVGVLPRFHGQFS